MSFIATRPASHCRTGTKYMSIKSKAANIAKHALIIALPFGAVFILTIFATVFNLMRWTTAISTFLAVVGVAMILKPIVVKLTLREGQLFVRKTQKKWRFAKE